MTRQEGYRQNLEINGHRNQKHSRTKFKYFYHQFQHSEISKAEQEATGMFDSSENTYQVNMIALSTILVVAFSCGVLYELCRWKRNRGEIYPFKSQRHYTTFLIGLHTFFSTSWENFTKYQDNSLLMITSLILLTSLCYYALI